MDNLKALTKVMDCAYASKSNLEKLAANVGKPVQVVLHWTACPYDRVYDDYHINILKNGEIVITEEDLSVKLAHNYMKNTASIGITLCCCYQATSNDLGPEPPTAAQLEVICQVMAVLSEALGLEIDKVHFPTHGESGDNEDYIVNYPEYTPYPHNSYGPKSTCDRWDLEILGPNDRESAPFNPDDEEHRGGTILRGRAAWYRMHYYGH